MSPRVTLHPSLLVLLSILYYLDARLPLPFLLAAGVHELGHIAVLRLYGIPIDALELTAAGAVLRTGPMGYQQELSIAASGPLCNLLLGLLFPLWPVLGAVSFTLGLYNLLPLPCLDGGRCLRVLLSKRLLPDQAAGIARTVGLILAGLLAAVGGAAACLGFGFWPLAAAGLLLLKAVSLRP